MDSAQKEGGDSPAGKDDITRPTTSGHLSNEDVSGKIQHESVGDGEEQDSSALSTLIFSEVTTTVHTGETDESQLPFSTDFDESLEEISEDVFESSKSEAVEAKTDSPSGSESVLAKNDTTKPSRSELASKDGVKNEAYDCKTTPSLENTAPKKENQGEMTEMSGERPSWSKDSKDQSCQVSCSPDDTSEVIQLKEKLAISKKDTETMQKLLEDVRNDYEELQKSFEKRESDVKKLIEEAIKEKDESRKEKTEFKRTKTSRKSSKASTSDERYDSRSSEKKKAGHGSTEAIDTGEMACPCFVQSIRKIVSDVREDFKETMSVFKQSSEEQCASIGNELTKLKDEYSSALHKKDSEIQIFEEVTKSLQSRVIEVEQEAVTLRATISSSFEEKQKLYDDIRKLKDELLRARQENETSQANLEKFKHGLKRYCTAEEYEELQRLNFKFGCDPSINGDGGQTSECKMEDDVSELKSKVAKFYPVLKKAKKEITKLKEEKQEIESRLQKRISEADQMEGYLNKQLSEALIEVKQKERGMTEVKEQLVVLKVENAQLNAKIEELEVEKEDLYKKLEQELDTVKIKLKKSNESLLFHKVKSEQLQEENDLLNDGYLEMKNYLKGEKVSVLEGMRGSGEYLSDDADSVANELKNESLLQKQLKAEKDKNELCLKEIEMLKKDVDQWKKMVRDDMDTGLGFLRIENKELKDEIQENLILIKQLVDKKKRHTRIIKKLQMENSLMKRTRDARTDEYEDMSLDSDNELGSEEPGYDRTTTQEHRVRFDKNGKIEKPDCSDDDEDSVFNVIKHGVHFPDDPHNDSSLEILEYELSISEKE